MAKDANGSTEEEKSNYQEGNRATQSGLEEAIDLLIQRKGFAATTKEMETILVKLPRLKADLLHVDADLTAYLANLMQVNPPSPPQLAAMKKTTEDIFKLTAESNVADQIASAATALANQWSATRAG